MFNNVPVRHSTEIGGQTITLETGSLAQQATATVVATHGETTVMAAAVVGREVDMDYFPLQIVYEERLYASGKIKGSRFLKREGRPSETAVLNGRMIDRSLRSLFNSNIRNDIQVVITVLSVDEINPPDILSVLAASAALSMCGISEFDGPVSSVRVGRIRGEMIVNPSYKEQAESELDLVVSGNGDNVVMLEAGSNIIPEDVMGQGFETAAINLGKLTEFQHEFLKLAEAEGLTKTTEVKVVGENEMVQNFWLGHYDAFENIFYADSDKESKDKAISELKDSLIDEQLEAFPEEGEHIGSEDAKSLKKSLETGWSKLAKKIVKKNALEKQRRIDGRSMDETRHISCQVDVLPRVHGSSLFNRGETQVLNVLTLGAASEAQLLDDMEDFLETEKRYIHHYNFPSYSVGETGRYYGPGRREIGHGALAEKALLPVLPDGDKFPYTMRLVSECLGSNGSTSMASTCGSCLSLMAAGVPITDMVAGVAMGLVMDGDKFEVLTDIQGSEDFYGDMDFKVTGTKDGITAIQLDNKVSGLTVEILKQALTRAYDARMHILGKMQEVITEPAANLSPNAPRVAGITIPLEKIGDVIGPSGKIIKALVAETGTKIDIEDETGKTLIFGTDAEMVKLALDKIKKLIKVYKAGEKVTAKIFRIEVYGAFAKIDGTDKEGMIHISKMANKRVEKVEDVVSMDQELEATITEVNDRGQIGLSLI